MADEPHNAEQPKNVSESLPRIRTYAADMSRIIKERGETLATIANAEQARPKPVAPEKKPLSVKTLAVIIGTGVLAVAGVVILIVTLLFNSSPEPSTPSSSIIFPNQTLILSAVADTPFIGQLAGARNTAELSLGEVLRILVTENDAPLEGSALAERLGFPSALSREIKSVMIGVHAFDRNQPFIIMEVAAYDRAFNALLEWEPDMGTALGTFFQPVFTAGKPPKLVFVDAIIRNLDVRTSQDEWPILYTFPERGILIITTNEFTLREVTSRLSSVRR